MNARMLAAIHPAQRLYSRHALTFRSEPNSHSRFSTTPHPGPSEGITARPSRTTTPGSKSSSTHGFCSMLSSACEPAFGMLASRCNANTVTSERFAECGMHANPCSPARPAIRRLRENPPV